MFFLPSDYEVTEIKERHYMKQKPNKKIPYVQFYGKMQLFQLIKKFQPPDQAQHLQ